MFDGERMAYKGEKVERWKGERAYKGEKGKGWKGEKMAAPIMPLTK